MNEFSNGREIYTQIVPLLPLRDLVIFPNMVAHFFVGRDRSIHAVEEAMKDKTEIFLVSQKDSKINNPQLEDLYTVGVLAKILQLVKLPDGTVKVLVEGKKRAKYIKTLEEQSFFRVEVEELYQKKPVDVEAQALIRSVKESFENYVKLNKQIPPEMLIPIQNMDDTAKLSDAIITHINIKHSEKQEVLEKLDSQKRLQSVFEHLESELEIIRVEKKIKGRVRQQMEKSQREYYLNEQMTAIQNELGERDEFKLELLNIEKKIKTAGLSAEAKTKAFKELKKLKLMAPVSPEATIIRNYLDLLTSLPWAQKTKDNLDLTHARAILDQEHFGLDKIKERILEFIAVKKLSENSKSQILCFLGPPGVGKTSLGKSIAAALERQYHRIALGGLKDESEIRGHRKTYIGAMPGKLIQALNKVKSNNPVIVLDEIDKMGNDHRGDPASAMLEVLDPEQNQNFSDHYLEVPFDLSKVLFIATANSYQSIPLPLLDRMEIIELSSYIEDEKINISKKHLLPKVLLNHGLKQEHIHFEDSAFKEIIRYHTDEAGVRNTERQIEKIIRKIAKDIVENDKSTYSFLINDQEISKYLGPRKFKYGTMEKFDQVGVTMGLCWTPTGGDTLAIEVTILDGTGKMTITGKLGDVMQESAQASYSYVRSISKELGLHKDFYKNIDIHIHVPEGATPKDGPSAGVAMISSLTSALTHRRVRKDVAMTGEITLRGNVLPIGGVKEKLLAAHRAGIKTVIIPDDNLKDLHDVPKDVLEKLTIVPAKHVNQVLETALCFEEGDPIKDILKNSSKLKLFSKASSPQRAQ